MTMHTTTSHHVLATARLWTAAAGIILAVGTGTLAAQSDPPRSTDTDASYSTVWERGTEFIVGSSGDLQIWIGLTDEREALLFAVNATDEPVLLDISRIRASALKTMKQGEMLVPVQTFGAEEWEKRLKNRMVSWTRLAAFGEIFSRRSKPEDSEASTDNAAGDFHGNIIEWPSAEEITAETALRRAQVQTMGAQLRSSFEALTSTLARKHTLAPGTFYGGVIHFEKKKTSSYTVSVPFGGEPFDFELWRNGSSSGSSPEPFSTALIQP